MSGRAIGITVMIAVFSLALAITGAEGACEYYNPPGAGNAYCKGSCPAPDDVCKKPLLNGHCACFDKDVIPIWHWPPHNHLELGTWGLNRVGYGQGPGFWAINATHAANMISWPSTQMSNEGLWGTGTVDTLPAASQAGLLYKVVATADPGVREIQFGGANVEIPSFVHSYWAPAPTGTNYLVLDPDYRSVGTVNTQTGAFSARIYTRVLNDHYSMEDGLICVLDLSGYISPSTGVLEVEMRGTGMQDGPPFADQD